MCKDVLDGARLKFPLYMLLFLATCILFLHLDLGSFHREKSIAQKLQLRRGSMQY